jgi:hypothetical protein
MAKSFNCSNSKCNDFNNRSMKGIARNGTTIMSDCWKAYSRIDRLDHKYKHLTVNHSLYFASPDDPTLHTNSVESIWCSAKVHFKMMRGVKRAYL